MLKNLSLRKKILFSIGSTITILMVIAAYFLVDHIAKLSRDSVEQQAKNYIAVEKGQIESFFAQYGRVVDTFVNTAHIKKWFSNWKSRDNNYKTSPGYTEVNKDFVRITSDPNILSSFFASAYTGEYFKENERTAAFADGRPYHAYKRPWWQDAVSVGRLYLGDLSADINTGAVSAVVQTPVFNDSGEMIGIGGVDLQLNRLGQMVEGISFQNEGYGFLLDSDLKVVHLSNQLSHNLSITDQNGQQKDSLEGLERDFSQTSGFRELNQMMRSLADGFAKVELKGESYYVVFNRLELDKPLLKWNVGLLLPAHLIDQPVSNAVQATSLGLVIMLLIVVAVILWATQLIAKPILYLTDVMEDIASGEGDLTQQINIHSKDEVGQLAGHMNTFIKKLRGLLQNTADRATQVGRASGHLNLVSTSTNDEIQQEKEQIDSVSVAVTEMASTVQEISRNAVETNTAAEEVQELTEKGSKLSGYTQEAMHTLAAHISEASEVVTTLEQESSNIGAVVDVINGIAEQTNLLALNAAIESARAGEQGRGFAVVADEVRSLASRTQESTDDIRNMIDKLQQYAQQASSMMGKGQTQAETTMNQTQEVMDALQAIHDSVGTVQGQSQQIATATEEQTRVAEDINENLHSINTLINNTSSNASELAQEANQLNQLAEDLNQSVNQFKL